MSDRFLNEPLSRRSFLRGAAVTGTVVASSGLLSGFGKPQVARAQDVSWAKEADVVVLGSGTGQVTAIRAVDNGLTAVVLEKAATGGGTTSISGGVFWSPNNFRMAEAGMEDSREEVLEYLSKATFGQGDEELVVAYVDNCNVTLEYLRSIGIDWEFRPNHTANDYHPEFPGGKAQGRSLSPISTIEGATSGGALMRMMQAAGEERGVEYLFETPAKQLIISPEGVVIGVAAERDGAEYNVRALRGVVIATGGFDHNPTMVTNYLRGPIYYPSAVRSNTGDGHLMGMALGADLRNMNEHWGWPVFVNQDTGVSSPATSGVLAKPGALLVNRFGHRFMNEASQYDSATRTFFTWDNALNEYINIPAFLIVDSGYRSRYRVYGFAPDAELPAWVPQADTLAELAGMLEIDAAALETTVARFNEFAALGVDPDYKRGESAYDLINGADNTRTELINPTLAPVVEPPFYGVTVWPGALGTCGGLHINVNGQVLNVWGETIPGLYAVGNASGSVFGAGYPAGGATIGAGMTFAYLAAEHITAQS